jgi:KaiC/GvpD/RAD55 family RecA-like ATPase
MAEKKKRPPLPAGKELSEKELLELLSPKREVTLKIQKTFEEMPDKFCAILLETPSKYSLLNTQLVKYFVDKKMKGTYLTVNRDLSDLIETLASEGIQTGDIIFIDAVTSLAEENKLVGSNFYYVDSPKNVTDLSVQLGQALEKLGKEKKFVIIDSISTLLVYNKEAVVERFVHSLSGKIRAHNAQGVFIVVEPCKKEIISMLTQFCDKLIEL